MEYKIFKHAFESFTDHGVERHACTCGNYSYTGEYDPHKEIAHVIRMGSESASR